MKKIKFFTAFIVCYAHAMAQTTAPVVVFDPIEVTTVGPVTSFLGPVDAAGNIYVIDGNRISRISPTNQVTVIAGTADEGFLDGPAATAQFNTPSGLALDSAGNIYVSDRYNQRIRKIAGGIVSTLAGNGSQGLIDGTGAAAQFSSPLGIALDAAGNIFVVDRFNYAVRKITPGAVVTTVISGRGMPGELSNGKDIAIDPMGNLYVQQPFNNLFKISPAGRISIVMPPDLYGNKEGIAADKIGNVYFGIVNAGRHDSVTQTVYKFFPSGNAAPLAGSLLGYSDGIGTAARFNEIQNISADIEGNIYVLDATGIRKISKPKLQLSSNAGTPSAAKYFSISGNYLGGAASLQAPPGYELSLSEAGSYSPALSIASVAGEIEAIKVYIRLSASAIAGAYNDSVVLSAGGATIKKLGVSGNVSGANGLQGVYYSGIALSGTPLLTRIDTTINFELTYASHPQVLSPAPDVVPEDMYSVRWTGQVQPLHSETYTFYTVSDDGIRLWVNGTKLVDNWVNQGATEKSGSIAMVAGQKYDIVIEYYENTGDAVTKLYWSSASTPKQIIPPSNLFPPAVPIPKTGNGAGLQGVYYNGIELFGNPLLTRVDTTINFELTYGSHPMVLSPAPGIVPEDMYSVRWTGQVQAQYSETYTFSTLSDDGIRLWVNGVKLVDNWVNQGATEMSGSIALVAGLKYDIVIEYYENTGDAVTKLYWSGASTAKQIIPKSQLYPPVIPGTGTGLQGVYYNGIALSGNPLLTRVDASINFELIYGNQPQVLSPAPGIVPEDMYSVRWTGKVQPQYSETYTFHTVADDGVRLWVNGVKLIDNWVNQSATEKIGSITLVAGQQYDIVMEYYENTGDAVTKLLWSSASTPKQIIPKSQLYPVQSNARIIAGSTVLQGLGVEKDVSITTMSAAISPNPVKRGQPAQLQINSNRSGQAVISMISSNGARISNQPISLVKGVNTIIVKTAGLAQGFYLINIAIGSKPIVVKLIIN